MKAEDLQTSPVYDEHWEPEIEVWAKIYREGTVYDGEKEAWSVL